MLESFGSLQRRLSQDGAEYLTFDFADRRTVECGRVVSLGVFGLGRVEHHEILKIDSLVVSKVGFHNLE